MITNKKDLPLIVGMALGGMLNPLNTAIIAVALTRLQQVFHLSYFELSWIISSYYLASAIAQPILGKLGDQIGRRRVFFFGLGLITISSLCAPFSPSFGWLLAFRSIQAFGTSAIMPNSIGIVRASVAGPQAKAMAVMSSIMSVSAAFGPVIGGVLLQWFDWQSLFLINFPFLLGAFVLAWHFAPADGKFNLRDFQVDLWGILWFSVAISATLLFFISLRTQVNWLWLLAALLTGGYFYFFESRHPTPFVNIPFLKQHPAVSLLYVQNFLANIVFYALLFGIPTFLQQVRNTSPLATGLTLLALAGCGLLVTPLSGRWVHARGSQEPLIAGMVLVLSGLLLLLTIGKDTPTLWLLFVLAVLGIGNSLNGFALQMALYEHIRKEETGIATGLFMTARFTGTIFCSSLLSLSFGSRITPLGFHHLALACALIVLVNLGIAHRAFKSSGVFAATATG